MPEKSVQMAELLENAPESGTRGSRDQIGSLNVLTNDEVLRGM